MDIYHFNLNNNNNICYLISSHYQSLLPPYRYFYVTHAARALQSHDLSGEGIKLWITSYFFDHTRTWRASPDEGSAQCRGHLRDSTNMKDDTHQAHIHSNKANRKWWLWRPNNIRGPCGPKVSWHLSYRWGRTPEKNSHRKPVPTGDRTWARCVTSVHATTCSTAVDLYYTYIYIN